jgi:hypothetical protein
MKLEEAMEAFKGCKGKDCTDCRLNNLQVAVNNTSRHVCVLLEAIRSQLEIPLTPEEAVQAVLDGKTLYSKEGNKVRELSYVDNYLCLDGDAASIRLTGWREEL